MSRCVSSFHEIAIIVFNASPQLRDVNFISTQQKKEFDKNFTNDSTPRRKIKKNIQEREK